VFKTVDAHGNYIEDLGPPCTYFLHDRLLYLVSFHSAAENKYSYNYQLAFQFDPDLHLATFEVVHTETGAEAESMFFSYKLFDGLQLENGLDFKFYTTDNMHTSVDESLGPLKPYAVRRLPQSLITQVEEEPLWFEMHEKFDRFSVKASALIKPSYDEKYFFSTQFASGFELWIDDVLVIGEGETAGEIQLKRHSWNSVKMLYRRSEANSAGSPVPQFLVQWQSAS